MKQMKTLNGYQVYDENTTHFISTLDELKTALAEGISPIVMEKDVEIEIGEYLELPEGTVFYGNNALFKRATGYEGTLIRMLPNSRLQDLNIDGNRENMVNPYWAETIEISTRNNCIVDHVRIENGNEAICAVGHNAVVKNCVIYNCGGNGIHFSGGWNIKAENNMIVNANRLWFENGESVETIGHEDGGIIWSDLCDYVNCTGNYVENAKAAFGSIDASYNSHIKLIGNTGKNCTKAVDTNHHGGGTVNNYDDYEEPFTGPWEVLSPSDLVISDNEFTNCGYLEVCVSNVDRIDDFRFVISNNILNNTSIKCTRAKNVLITNNIMVNLAEQIYIEMCEDFIISGNRISGNVNELVSVNNSKRMKICGNTVSGEGTVITASWKNSIVTVEDNIIENTSESSSNTTLFIEGTGMICSGNRLSIKSGTGIRVGSDSICADNMIICATADLRAIVVAAGKSACVVANNITNGAYQFAATASETVVYSNNVTCGAVEFATA